MIGEAGFQDLQDYRQAELGAYDLQPGMIVAGINVSGAASEFDLDDSYYTAYPALVLGDNLALRKGHVRETTTIQRLDTAFTPQEVIKSNYGFRYNHQLPYEWTQFYDLGVSVSMSPMSERTAHFILDHVAPESKLDVSSGLFTDKGLVVAKQLALTALAKKEMKNILIGATPQSPEAA